VDPILSLSTRSVAPLADSARRSHPRHVGSFILGGTALALIGSSIGLGVASDHEFQSASRQCLTGGCPGAQISDGRGLQIGSAVLLGVGVGAAAGAVITLFIERHHGHQRLMVGAGK
jgi:hypothetical protein